jgi:hypothetical protein
MNRIGMKRKSGEDDELAGWNICSISSVCVVSGGVWSRRELTLVPYALDFGGYYFDILSIEVLS